MRIHSLHCRMSIADLDTYQKKSDSDSSISQSPPKHTPIETSIKLEQEDPPEDATHDLQAKEIPKGETEAKGMDMKHRTSPKKTRKKLRKEPYNKKPLKDSDGDDDSDDSVKEKKEKKTQLKERSTKGFKRKECSSLEREDPPKKTRVDTSTSEEDPDEVRKEDNKPKACKPISRPVLSPFNYGSHPRLKAGVKTHLSPFDVLSQIISCSQSTQASDTTGCREGATCNTIGETTSGEKAGKTAGQSCDKDTSDGTARDAVKESSSAETCQASKDTGQTGTAVGQHDEGTSETTVQDSGRDNDPTGQTTTVHNDTARDSASELNHESERDGSEEQSFSEPVMVNMGLTNHSSNENSAENNGDRVSSFHGIKCDIDVYTDISSDEADLHVLPHTCTTATESSDGQHGALVC